MPSIPRVAFQVAGVQKGGTTALHSYLLEHPEISVAPEKEVHFFDDESVDWETPSYGLYESRFPLDRGVCGDCTPIYIYWPNSLERIRRYNEHSKFVLILRNPIERAWSHWRMEVGRGVEQNAFSWCIRDGRARLREGSPVGYHREFSYVERGFYGAQLERFLGLFDRGQLLLLRSEHLQADPASALATLCEFLGVSPFPFRPVARRVHVGARPLDESMSAADREHLAALYADDAELLTRLTGLPRLF